MSSRFRLFKSGARRLLRRLGRRGPWDCLLDWLARIGPLHVVDVGAHRGEFTGLLADRFPVERAWLIEPQAALADRLAHEFLPPRYSVHRLALSDQRGSVELEVSRGADATASLLRIRSELRELSQ